MANDETIIYFREYLSQNSVLENEDLLVMYDVTLSLDTSECAILTTRNFIYHKKGRGDTRVPYDDIIEVRIEDATLATYITFTHNSGSESPILTGVEIASLNNAELFINTLKSKVSDNIILDIREN
jgi:hypothetical protein